MATGVAIIGMMKMVRAMPRPRKRRWKQTAAATPKMTGSSHRERGEVEGPQDRPLEPLVAEHAAVIGQARKVRAPPTWKSLTDMNKVKTQGNRITAATTSPAGRMNGQ